MSDRISKGYFDKFLDKAATRSIISDERKNGLSTAWHWQEKNKSVKGFYSTVLALSVAGVVFGITRAIPEAANSSATKSFFSFLATAARFIYYDLYGFFSLLPVKAGYYFLAGLLANYVGARLGRSSYAKAPLLAKATYVFGAALHVVATGYLLVYGVVQYHWEELEVTSIGFWCVIPLIMTILVGCRPLFYQLLTAAVIAVHALAFYCGVSGNTFIAFDISIAVIFMCVAQNMANRDPRLALSVRYMSMIIICFLLYCTGFVWDLPAILQFRGYIKPGAHHPSMLFLIGMFTLACLAIAWMYFFTPDGRSSNGKKFSLLLLVTLFFANL